ncbi:MAG: response regulator [Ignavibacteria bacterium]|nr:response regulator [Ignavibacteria bacterium]
MLESPEVIEVLIVDDDSSFFSLTRHHFSKFQGRKFNLSWKQDGKSGLKEIEENKSLHIALIDYYLPEMNGLEVTKAIREKKIDLPIVFLTTNRDFRLAIEVMKYGVDDYIVKDEAIDLVLPRTVVNVLERLVLKQKIEEQIKADLIARRRTEAIKELVVTVCHEFNNPLAAMKISTDIISRQQITAKEKDLAKSIDGNIKIIEKEITKLRDINFEKIDYSKVQTG